MNTTPQTKTCADILAEAGVLKGAADLQRLVKSKALVLLNLATSYLDLEKFNYEFSPLELKLLI